MSVLRRFVLALVALSVTACADGEGADAALEVGPVDEPRPNILLVISDDQGYGDLGCYGSPDAFTPRLDALAAQGLRLTDFYVASPMCSPSRASLLTGRMPWHHGLRQALVPGNPEAGLDPDEVLLPALLGAEGYHTGLVGKWHLGEAPGMRPTERGFDEFFGMLRASSGYWSHSYRGTPDLWRGTEAVRAEGTYSTDLFAAEAIAFLERHAGQRWFLTLSYNAPHLADDRRSLPAPDADRERFADLEAAPQRRDYLAAVSAMDAATGRVLDALDRLKLAENTLVVFLSDNGPLPPYGSAGGLRRGKDTLDEGGIRVPCLLRWPGVTPAGSVSTEPILATDLTATLLVAAGIDTRADVVLDGRNVRPVLAGEARTPRAALVWDHPSRIAGRDGHYEHDRVIRRGSWRLTRHRDGSVELADLAADPGQTRDVSAAHPDQVVELLGALDDVLASVPAPGDDP